MRIWDLPGHKLRPPACDVVCVTSPRANLSASRSPKIQAAGGEGGANSTRRRASAILKLH